MPVAPLAITSAPSHCPPVEHGAAFSNVPAECILAADAELLYAWGPLHRVPP